MKGIKRSYRHYFKLFILIFLFVFLISCDGNIPSTHGSIDINSSPAGATVYLDGIDTGQITPIVLTNVSEGVHMVKLELYMYESKEDINVLVTAGQTTYLNWTLPPANIKILTLQPGTEGKDTYVRELSPDAIFGNLSKLYVGYIASKLRAYLQFDLNALSTDAVVTSADFMLYQDGFSASGDVNIGVYQINNPWEESSLTWNTQPNSASEAENICNCNPGTNNTWRTWKIEDIVKDWRDGNISNNGIMLKATNELSNKKVATFYSFDGIGDITKHPKLVITYYIP